MGIGTLIVFIAMVLVASIGAGALIETAGLLQSKSQQTGEQAQQGVTNRVQVHSVTGNVSQTACYGSGEIRIDGIDVGGISYDCLLLDSGDSPDVWHVSGGDDRLIFDGQSTDILSDGDLVSFTRVQRDDARDQIRVRDETRDEVIVTATPPISIDESTGPDDELINLNNPDGTGYVSIANFADTDETVRFTRPSGNVTSVDLTVRLSPGSSAVDLRDATVSYVSDDGIADLTYTTGKPTADQFSVSPVVGDDAVLSDDEQVTIHLDTWRIDDGLQPGDTATVRVVTPSGTVTRAQLGVPATTSRDVVVLTP
ncbi:hypothetical protein [Halorientalis pallida]|uniref:hypothetical protein n=1 Tax=Halorientalis pallida TaxID=2479928 RepID=UPI00374387A6